MGFSFHFPSPKSPFRRITSTWDRYPRSQQGARWLHLPSLHSLLGLEVGLATWFHIWFVFWFWVCLVLSFLWCPCICVAKKHAWAHGVDCCFWVCCVRDGHVMHGICWRKYRQLQPKGELKPFGKVFVPTEDSPTRYDLLDTLPLPWHL